MLGEGWKKKLPHVMKQEQQLIAVRTQQAADLDKRLQQQQQEEQQKMAELKQLRENHRHSCASISTTRLKQISGAAKPTTIDSGAWHLLCPAVGEGCRKQQAGCCASCR